MVFCLARVLKKEEKVGKRKKKESTPTCIIVIHMHIKTNFVCLYYCVAKKKVGWRNVLLFLVGIHQKKVCIVRDDETKGDDDDD